MDIDENSIFSVLENQGYVYNRTDIDFGNKGNIIYPDGNIVVEWFYTGRDGIYVHVKRKKPYKILFEYFDGSYFINDKSESVISSLTKLKLNLEMLRVELKSNGKINAYNRLESIILQYINNKKQS